jgi:hypothetical protein
MSQPFYAILRVNKITDKAHATAATAHNYRQYSVENADEHALHPSPELLNTAERGYWELASERISQAGITPRRRDAIRCVEVVMTATPEWFKRNEQGQAADYSTSKWAQDNLTYLQKTFGKENVVAFKIHQDEKTPHIHALIIPITPDGRLSAHDMVGRPTLKKYQSSYAAAMAEHGLQRGVENSQTKHKPMRQFYGQQAQTMQQVGELVGPVTYKPAEVKEPSTRFSNLQQWANEQTKAVNDQVRPQVEEANKRAEKALSLALENAAAKEQVQVLRKQLGTAKDQVQELGKQLGTSAELKETTHKRWQAEVTSADNLARRLAGGGAVPADWLARGNKLLDQDVQAVEDGRQQLNGLREKVKQAERAGNYTAMADLYYPVKNGQKAQDELEQQLAKYSGGAARLQKLDAKQADEAKKKADDDRKAEELATQRAQQQAEDERQAEADRKIQAEKKARELDERQRQQRKDDQAREKAQIERVCLEVIPKNYYTNSYNSMFVKEAAKLGIEVKQPSPGQFMLSVKGSEHQFAHQDLQVGTQAFAQAYNQQQTANWKSQEQFEREREQGREIAR